MSSRPESAPAAPSAADSEHASGLEGLVARLLRIGTYVAIGLIALGVVLMLATGRSPLDVAPAFALDRLVADLATLQPAGFLWLGLVVVLLTPAARVAVGAVGYAREGDRIMARIAALVLIVIAIGVVLGIQGA